MKKNYCFLLCCLFITFVSASLYSQTTEVERWSIRGDEYYKNRDYQNAVNAYTQVINLRLEEENEAEQRAKRNSTLPAGMYYFTRTWTGLEMNAYLQRGRSYYRLQNYDAAILDYEVVAKEYDPSFYHIYVSLGDAYGAKGDFTNASLNWGKYLERMPDSETMNYGVDKSFPADMWFCSTLWEKSLLSDNPKYVKWIQEICNKNSITRTDIENFYKDNRGW